MMFECMLEVDASYDLHILQACLGVARSNNDINVLNQLSLFNIIVNDTKGYYVAEIYLKWILLVKIFVSTSR